MPTVNCPIEPFTHIAITYPDDKEWRYVHRLQFLKGYGDADDDAPVFIKLLCGTIALCEIKADGEDFEDINNKPLWYTVFFDWLWGEVYPKYIKAQEPPEKNPSAQ